VATSILFGLLLTDICRSIRKRGIDLEHCQPA
jgi:hypothetical protein